MAWDHLGDRPRDITLCSVGPAVQSSGPAEHRQAPAGPALSWVCQGVRVDRDQVVGTFSVTLRDLNSVPEPALSFNRGVGRSDVHF